MKKWLILLIIGIFTTFNISLAEPIVQLAAPRVVPKVIDGFDIGIPITKDEEEATQKPVQKENTKSKVVKKHKKKNHKKHIAVKVDYNKISKLIEYGYYDIADNMIQSALVRNPKDINLQALWAISLAKQLKLDPAQSDLDSLLKKYPDNSNLHYAQGVVYYQRTTSSNMIYRGKSQELFNSSLVEFNKAIELDKKNAKAYNAAGVISLKLDKDKDAIDYFNKAIAIDKNYSMAIDNLGTIDFVAGNYTDAEKKFKQALNYNTQNTTAMYHLAQVAAQKQDWGTALIYLNNALYINPNTSSVYNLMGKAYLAQGNEAAAINAFKKSIAVRPEFVLSYFDLANIYQQRGDSEFAIEQLKTALSIEPNYSDARLKLADISFATGKYKQAIEVYSSLIGVDGYNDAALKGLAGSYYGQAQNSSNKAMLGSNKDLFKALDYINKALVVNKSDLEMHLAKLKLTKLTNQPEESKVELNKIIQSPANDLMSTLVKAEAYMNMNDYSNAQKTFETATQLSTELDDDLYLLEILVYHRQLDIAQMQIQKILKQDAKNQQALNSVDYIQKAKKYSCNYLKSAQYFAKTGNLTTAIEYLNRSLGANPNNAGAHLLIAEVYEKQKDYPNALINYQIYLDLLPQASNSKIIQFKVKKIGNRL